MTAFAGAVFAAASPAFGAKPLAAVNPPTLHGFCSLAAPCTDNGTNTPTGVNPTVFSFAASGKAATGTLLIDILVPNNVAAPGSFTISGALLGISTYTASLVSPTAWTLGQLDSYLGITASPTNPIGAYLPTTLTYQPGTTGFYVYQANVGSRTLLGQSDVGKAGQDAYLMELSQALAQGSYIVGYLSQSGQYGATANSGAILQTSPPPPAVPEPATWAMMLLGFGAVGFSMRRGRHTSGALTQTA
ncbi:hypothetical protein GCM10022276_10460 [Sphingomonas limnosediminicola]|uniref:Ice-binding protein C-terminal domain-containing protein n=2 Tax=Sphingomonas limnosediminicola TaxID=940133 RepID=A0ABP7L4X0_9SPHN